MNTTRQRKTAKRYYQEEEDDQHDIIVKRVPYHGCMTDTATTVAEAVIQHVKQHHGGDEDEYSLVFPRHVDVQEANRNNQPTINAYVQLILPKRNQELVSLCARHPLFIFSDRVEVVESKTVARHHQDPHKSYLWSVRTGAAACRVVGCRRCGPSSRQDVQSRLSSNSQGGMKRERSQQQIQQEEKKSRTDDLLFYAEIRTPTDTRRRPLVDQRDFLGLNVSNRTYRPLSAGGSETTSKRASYEPSGNLSNDSGAYSKSTSPESLREDTANAINHSSKSSPNKAEDLSGLTAPSSIEKHSATNTSRLSTPQLLINTELEQQCQLDLSGIHSGASTHTPSDVAMEPALQVRSEPTSPSAEGGGERIESSDREATSQTIQAPQPNASYDVATTGQQLASDLAIITIGTAEAEETALACTTRPTTPPPAIYTGIVGIPRPDRSPYWVVQPWPTGESSVSLAEWQNTFRH